MFTALKKKNVKPSGMMNQKDMASKMMAEPKSMMDMEMIQNGNKRKKKGN